MPTTKTREGAAIGVDAGGTKIAAGLVDAHGEILQQVKVPTPRASETSALEALHEVVGIVLKKAGDRRVRGIGVGIAGLTDTKHGTFVYGPNFALRDFKLADNLSKQFKMPVTIDNDANVAAWAEYHYGAGERCGDMIMITLGTGIGAGIISQDRLLRGGHGFAAEVGHMTTSNSGGLPCTCGERGCWETVASGRALDFQAEIIAQSPAGAALEGYRDKGASSGQMLSVAAVDGLHVAVEALDKFADLVSVGLQNLVQCFDPERIVIGGGVSAIGEPLFEPIRKHLALRLSGRAFRPEVPILRAKMGQASGIVGAAALIHLP